MKILSVSFELQNEILPKILEVHKGCRCCYGLDIGLGVSQRSVIEVLVHKMALLQGGRTSRPCGLVGRP